MKHISLLTISLLITISAVAQVPNASFETWVFKSSGAYEDPDDWRTSNYIRVSDTSRPKTAIKTTDAYHGTYALRMQTVSAFSIDFPGNAVTDKDEDPTTVADGFPYTSRPDFLKGYFKANVLSGDSNVIEVELFRNSGSGRTIVGSGRFANGGSIGSYSAFAVVLNYALSGAPDSAEIRIYSSGGSGTPKVGTWIQVDSLSFGTSSGGGITANFSFNDVCFGDATTFNDLSIPTPISWLWKFGDGATSSSPAPTHTYSSTGSYTVTLIVYNGSVYDSIKKTVTIVNNPTLAMGSSATICPGDSVKLNPLITAGAHAGGIWDWSPSTGLSDPSTRFPWASPTGTTTYSVQWTDTNGCESNTVSITINHYTPPTVTAGFFGGGDSIICPGEGVYLAASGSAIVSYAWSPPTGLSDTTSSNPYATPGTTTTYTIEVTSSDGCHAYDSVTVYVTGGPTGAITPATDTIKVCYDMSPGSQMITASGGTNYTWAPATNLSGTSGATVTYTAPGMADTTDYYVIVEDAAMCVDTVHFTVVSYKCNTAVGDILRASSISVFPNPTTGIVNFEFSEAINDEVHMEVTNILGEVIFESTLPEIAQGKKECIDISAYASGIYFVNLRTDDDSYTVKLTKN